MPTLLSATGSNYTKSSLAALFANQTISTGSWLTILVSLILAFAVGLFIYWIYRTNYRGVMYNNNFGLTLVLMTLITTPVVMCIRDSIQLSMGMVGALSIVRFHASARIPPDPSEQSKPVTSESQNKELPATGNPLFMVLIALIALGATGFRRKD